MFTQSTERRSAITTVKFAVAPVVTDTEEKLEYGDVITLQNTLITAKYTPKMNTASQYAGGIEVESYVAKNGGTLDITARALNSADEAALYGSKVDETTGVLVSNKDDIVPDNMVIYSTRRSDGKLNLYKFAKAKFTSQGESVQTIDENGITYQALSLQAGYKPTINNGNDMYVVKGADPTTDKALIEEWFASALGGITVQTEGQSTDGTQEEGEEQTGEEQTGA